MLPTSSFSTGKRYVPTSSILIAFNWFGAKSTLGSGGAALVCARAAKAAMTISNVTIKFFTAHTVNDARQRRLRGEALNY